MKEIQELIKELQTVAERCDIDDNYDINDAATCSKSSQVGNTAKMREALDKLLGVFNSGLVEYSNWCNKSDIAQIQYVIDKAGEALSAPPRNCDVGTAEEQVLRHDEWCHKYGIDGTMDVPCGDPDWHCNLCFARWSQMPYEKKEDDTIEDWLQEKGVIKQ